VKKKAKLNCPGHVYLLKQVLLLFVLNYVVHLLTWCCVLLSNIYCCTSGLKCPVLTYAEPLRPPRPVAGHLYFYYYYYSNHTTVYKVCLHSRVHIIPPLFWQSKQYGLINISEKWQWWQSLHTWKSFGTDSSASSKTRYKTDTKYRSLQHTSYVARGTDTIIVTNE
jgi:hypothetical protein